MTLSNTSSGAAYAAALRPENGASSTLRDIRLAADVLIPSVRKPGVTPCKNQDQLRSFAMVKPVYLPRVIDDRLARAVASVPIVIVDGPRAAGKTTSAQRLAGSVVALPDDLERLAADPAAFLGDLPAPVLIDEWQLAGTDLLWVLKRIVDADPSPGRFILTGSVEPATYGPTYPLTGRAATVVMRPMSQVELDGRGDQPTWVDQVVGGERPTSASGSANRFDLGRLAQTGFPAGRLMPDPGLLLDGYANAVAQRAGDEGRDATRLLNTLRVLATLEGQAVPDQRVWTAAGIDRVTWKAYEDLLGRTHITASSPSFATNRLKRLTEYPKRFLADTALSMRLASISPSGEPAVLGPYVESFVMQQLRPQVDRVGGAISHLRTGSSAQEVDVVIDVGGVVFAIEVKSSASPVRKDARHLDWLRDRLDDRFAAGFVVHTGGDAFPLGDRIWALPINALC